MNDRKNGQMKELEDNLKKILYLVHWTADNSKEGIENPLVCTGIQQLYIMLRKLKKDYDAGYLIIENEQTKRFFNEFMAELTGLKRKRIKWPEDKEYFLKKVLERVEWILKDVELEAYLKKVSFYGKRRWNLKWFHHSICKNMFRSIENSYDDRHGIGYKNRKVWVSIDDEDNDEKIKFEVISTDILAYDRYVFRILRNEESNSVRVREYIKELYRPYLIEYYVDREELKKKEELIQTMRHGNGWYPAAFAKKVTDEDEKRHPVFGGTLVHCASPIVCKGWKLIILDEIPGRDELNKIKRTYDMSDIEGTSEVDIKNELERIFKGIEFHTVRIYKAGNGNCLYINGKSESKKASFFFDMGLGTDWNTKDAKSTNRYEKVEKLIKRAHPQCVIISHWDTDHFIGCMYAEKSMFEVRWIAPSIKTGEHKVNAKRILCYLYILRKVMVMDRGSEKSIEVNLTNNSRMHLYMGNTRDEVGHITPCNYQGIAVEIENGKTVNGKIRCLMQGDVPYVSLPKEAKFETENPYEYLVAPHHGSQMDYSLLKKREEKDGQAVICCTNNKCGGDTRPTKEHLQALKDCYEDVKTTEEANVYIEFNLLSKSKMIIV